MAHVHHFTYGWITLVLAFAVSVLGSVLGLVCAGRAGEVSRPGWRFRWIGLGALSIGGMGIWLMHFIALLGFTVSGTSIYYDPWLLLLSAAIAVGIVAVGSYLVGRGQAAVPRVLVAGAVTGLGVTATQYIGMAAMRIADATLRYDARLVVATVLIAVAACTVALWFTVVIRTRAGIAAAAPIIAVAMCGMHYTGMASMRVEEVHTSGFDQGMDVTTLLLPCAVIVGLVLVGLLYAMLSAPGVEERAADALTDELRREFDGVAGVTAPRRSRRTTGAVVR